MDMVYKHISTVTISSTEWVALGTSDISWNLSSIGGVPIQIVELPADTTPTAETKCMFTLGGLINNLVSKIGKQLWAKVTEGEGTVTYFDNSLDGFEPITELRASIIGLNKEVIKLTTRATRLELDNNSNKARLTSVEKAVASIQGIVGNVIADLVSIRVDTTITRLNMKNDLRSDLNKFEIDMLNKLRTYFNQYEDDVVTLDRTVATLSTAMNAMVNAPNENVILMSYASMLVGCQDSAALVTLLNTIKDMSLFILAAKNQELVISNIHHDIALNTADINILKEELGIGEGYWSYTETTGRIALYWDSMTRISEATTEEEVATVYDDIINDPEFDPTMTPVITVLRDMMTFIIQSNTVNAAQDEQIDEIEDYIDNPVVGAGLNSDDLFNLLGTPEES